MKVILLMVMIGTQSLGGMTDTTTTDTMSWYVPDEEVPRVPIGNFAFIDDAEEGVDEQDPDEQDEREVERDPRPMFQENEDYEDDEEKQVKEEEDDEEEEDDDDVYQENDGIPVTAPEEIASIKASVQENLRDVYTNDVPPEPVIDVDSYESFEAHMKRMQREDVKKIKHGQDPRKVFYEDVKGGDEK